MPSVSYDLQRVEVRNAISREDWVVVKAPSRRKLARDMAAAAEQSDETKRIAEILHAFVDGPLRRAREGSAITSQVSVIPMRSDASSERASATAPPGHWQPSEVVAGGDAIAKELWSKKPKRYRLLATAIGYRLLAIGHLAVIGWPRVRSTCCTCAPDMPVHARHRHAHAHAIGMRMRARTRSPSAASAQHIAP